VGLSSEFQHSNGGSLSAHLQAMSRGSPRGGRGRHRGACEEPSRPSRPGLCSPSSRPFRREPNEAGNAFRRVLRVWQEPRRPSIFGAFGSVEAPRHEEIEAGVSPDRTPPRAALASLTSSLGASTRNLRRVRYTLTALCLLFFPPPDAGGQKRQQ